VNFILFIAILLAGASYASFTARSSMRVVDGSEWALGFCSSIKGICDYPDEFAYAAAGLAAIWLVMKFVLAIRS